MFLAGAGTDLEEIRSILKDKPTCPLDHIISHYLSVSRSCFGKTRSQVWVSCSSVRLVAPAAGRSVEDDDDDEDYEDYSLYTDEDYAELEQAFEFTF